MFIASLSIVLVKVPQRHRTTRLCICIQREKDFICLKELAYVIVGILI